MYSGGTGCLRRMALVDVNFSNDRRPNSWTSLPCYRHAAAAFTLNTQIYAEGRPAADATSTLRTEHF